MKSNLKPSHIVLGIVVVLLLIGGAVLFMMRNNEGSNSDVFIEDQQPKTIAGQRGVKPPRADLPAGVPRLNIPLSR